MFPECHSFVAVSVTRSNNLVSLHLLDRDKLEHVSLIQLVTDIVTKPRLLGNMLPNMKTGENEWSDSSDNFRTVTVKLHELTGQSNRKLSEE